MTNRSRTHLTAWLGLIAMCLIVCAPIVSQLVASARQHQEAVLARADAQMAAGTQMGAGMQMTADMQMAGDMHMGAAAGSATSDSDHHASKPSLAACGYCNLLATHAVMPAAAPATELVFTLVMFAAAPVLSTRFTPIGAFPSGRPRAPPVVS